MRLALEPITQRAGVDIFFYGMGACHCGGACSQNGNLQFCLFHKSLVTCNGVPTVRLLLQCIPCLFLHYRAAQLQHHTISL